MKKPKRPKRIPPLTTPTNEDYARMAALRMCGGCSGRGKRVVRLIDGGEVYTLCEECIGHGTIER